MIFSEPWLACRCHRFSPLASYEDVAWGQVALSEAPRGVGRHRRLRDERLSHAYCSSLWSQQREGRGWDRQ